MNSLLSLLTREGFTISTGTILDIQKVLANLGEKDIQDVDTLKNILGPLICRNKGEQEKFYSIFEKYIANLHQREVTLPVKKRWKKLPVIIASVLAVAVAIYLLIKQHPPAPVLKPYIVLNIHSKTQSPGDTTTISLQAKDTMKGHSYITTAKIGDNEYIDQREIRIAFADTGHYPIDISLLDGVTKKVLYTYQDEHIVYCEARPVLGIEPETGSAYRKTYVPFITRPSKDSNRYIYNWYINDSLASRAKKFTTAYSSQDPYTIKLVMDVKNIHCSTDSLVATIQEMPRNKMVVAGSGTIDTKTKTNWGNVLLTAFGMLIIPFGSAYIFYRYKKRKDAPIVVKQKPVGTGEPVPETKTYDGPYMIEFKEQEDKITTEEGISQLAEILRKRHTSDIWQLNIRKTINRTIRKGGFPALQFTPKTQPLDFLILIDKEYPDGHLVKLFEHIIKRLRNEQVNLTVYSFYKEPLLLSNESLNHYLLPLERVARLYPNTILFIFTQANGFFKSFEVQLKDWVVEKFSSWHTKLIITPLAKENWGVNELALYQSGFTVVPADVNAQQAISDEINEMIDKNKLKQDITPGVYSARLFNFNRVEQVTDYIDKAIAANARLLKTEVNANLVKQWLFATALYPYVNWNVTVAIGKAIEEKKCDKIGELVNYTNLLLLSRIQWMNDSQLPDTLRAQLLQRLEKEIEVIARKAIVGMLNEIAPSVKDNSLVIEEFIYLKTTNKFLLHSNDKNDSDLSQSEYEQMKMYTEKQYLDWPLEEQLNNRSSNHLLKHPENESVTVTPAEYFNLTKDKDEAKEEEQRKKEKRDKRRRAIVRWAQTVGIFLAIFTTALITLNSFSVTSNLLSRPPADILVSYKPGNLYGDYKDIYLNLSHDGNQFAAGPMTDTVFQFSEVHPDYLDSKLVLQLVLKNGTQQQTFNAPLDSIYSRYDISFVTQGPRPPVSIRYNNPDAYDQVVGVADALSESYNTDYMLSDFSDSSRLVYYVQSDSLKADSIARIAGAASGLKITTMLIPENRNPPAVPLLFLNFGSKEEVYLSRTSLPNWTNEIWMGGTSNRLLNINLAQKTIYYSTGTKSTFGTYRISGIYRAGTQLFKIISQTDQGYKVFFLRLIQTGKFALSVCQPFYSTQQEAMAVNQSNCDRENPMSHYYENGGPNRIYLPVAGSSLNAQQGNKITRIVDSLRSAANNKWEVTIDKKYSVHRNYIRQLDIETIGDLIGELSDNNSQLYPQTATELTTGTPFDRNYVDINIKINRTPIEWIFIMETELIKDYTLTGPDFTNLSNTINTLAKNDLSRMKLVAYYQSDADKKEAEAKVNGLKKFLVDAFPKLSNFTNRIIVETEQLNQSQQQQNAPAGRENKVRIFGFNPSQPKSY